MVSCLALVLCKMYSEAYDTAAIMKSKSSTVSTVCSFSLLALEFFRDVGFVGETFLFLDVSGLSGGFCSSVTSPFFCLSYSPLCSSLSTSSPPPLLGESDAVFSDVLCISCTYSFFFILLLLGASYSSRVTTGLPMRLASDSSACLTSIRNSTVHSLVISFRSSSMNL
jgi:hypothetical protein